MFFFFQAMFVFSGWVGRFSWQGWTVNIEKKMNGLKIKLAGSR